MAHGGHHGGHHSHHRSYYRSRSSTRYYSNGSGSGTLIPSIFALFLIILMGTVFLKVASSSSLTGKAPLDGQYEVYKYLLDEQDYFSNKDQIIEGLEYLHEKTNVQVVLMSSNESWSDSKAVKQYYEMFDDEAHVLIIIPSNWSSSTTYYAIGDLADTVINDSAVNHLLDTVGNKHNGRTWKSSLTKFADTLISE